MELPHDRLDSVTRRRRSRAKLHPRRGMIARLFSAARVWWKRRTGRKAWLFGLAAIGVIERTRESSQPARLVLPTRDPLLLSARSRLMANRPAPRNCPVRDPGASGGGLCRSPERAPSARLAFQPLGPSAITLPITRVTLPMCRAHHPGGSRRVQMLVASHAAFSFIKAGLRRVGILDFTFDAC